MATEMEEKESSAVIIDESKWNEEDLRLEKEHFKKIVNAFLYYKMFACLQIDRGYLCYKKISAKHKALLPDYPSHVENCFKAIDLNYQLIKNIIGNAVGFFENSDITDINWSQAESQVRKATFFDMEKVSSTIKQFYRDWSEEGECERKMCYDPIINELTYYFPADHCNPSFVNVLVPGAGLGRLAYDIARLGYCCQGNEFSMYMLLASHFILNKNKGIKNHVIYPWVLKTSNNYKYEDQLMSMKIPDVDPADLPQYGLFSMAAGDFLEVYSEKDQWDCIACCFFIDTAHNIIEYLEKIYEILKPGGIWINFGPLLYHFADMPDEMSLELSWEDIRRIVCELGFVILKEERSCPSAYVQNPYSMIQLNYQSVLLVAQKPNTK